MKISKEAIEAGARVLRSNGVGLSAFEMVGLILEAALDHQQECKETPQTVQSPTATATQVAIDDAEVERVARACYEGSYEHYSPAAIKWDELTGFSKPQWRRIARAAIRAIREGGQRWGVWNCDSLSQDNAWYWCRKNHGERRHFVTYDEEAAHAMVNQLNADCNSDKYEVRPYPGERAKTPDEVAADWVNEIRTAVSQERVKEIQAKLVAMLRDAKGGK